MEKRRAAKAAAASFAIEELLTYRLWMLSNRMTLGAERTLARHGLTVAQWRILAVVARHAPTNAAEIAKRIAFDKAAISRVLGQLARAGYVKRQSDPADGRRETLSLTKAGERLHAKIVPLSQARQARLVGTLSPGDRAAIPRIFAHLLERADELLEETAKSRSTRRARTMRRRKAGRSV